MSKNIILTHQFRVSLVGQDEYSYPQNRKKSNTNNDCEDEGH